MNEALTPEQLVLQAKDLYEQEEYLEAAGVFGGAAESYRAAGDALMAAEMVNNRSVALLMAGEAEEALAAVGDTPTVFAESGDVRRQALALGNRAAALAKLNRKEEAEQTYWDSARLLGEIGENDLRASVLQAISRLQLGGGRYMEALSSMESGLEQTGRLSFSQRILKRLIGIPKKLINRS